VWPSGKREGGELHHDFFLLRLRVLSLFVLRLPLVLCLFFFFLLSSGDIDLSRWFGAHVPVMHFRLSKKNTNTTANKAAQERMGFEGGNKGVSLMLAFKSTRGRKSTD
jgi:hypothetical protein